MFKTVKDGQLPTKGSKYSGCVDLYAREDVVIGAGETKLIPLGVCVDSELLNKAIYRELVNAVGIDNADHPSVERDAFEDMWRSSHYLQLMLRSSLSKELIIANGVGIIDLDYKDEIMIRLHNPNVDETRVGLYGEVINFEPYIIKKGDRVAQITLLEHKAYLFGIESEEERVGGFGSTGKK